MARRNYKRHALSFCELYMKVVLRRLRAMR
jgi:hypothetical protein